MSWTNKTKNVVATLTNKIKIPQSGDVCEIRTPDGKQVLVGSPESYILIYKEGFSNWVMKTKIES